LKNGHNLSKDDLREVEKFYLLAEMLTESTEQKYVVDHIMPLSRGGIHHQSNLQVITLSANSRKRDKYPFEVEERFFPVGYGNTADELHFCPDNSWVAIA